MDSIDTLVPKTGKLLLMSKAVVIFTLVDQPISPKELEGKVVVSASKRCITRMHSIFELPGSFAIITVMDLHQRVGAKPYCKGRFIMVTRSIISVTFRSTVWSAASCKIAL
jgi:hypothetical protein